MRTGILGVLACGYLGTALTGHAQAQYQEPIPIRSAGPGYPAAGYTAPSRFPTYGSPVVPVQQSRPMPMAMPYGYPAPQGWRPVAYTMPAPPQGMMPPHGMMPLLGAQGQPPAFQPPAFQPLPPTLVPPQEPQRVLPDVAPPQGELPPGGPPALPVTEIIEEDGPDEPLQPPEPFMVGPESTWKPLKGYNVYGSAEAIFWWLKAQPVPQTLTLTLTDQLVGTNLTSQKYDGARFYLGSWVNARHNVAIEGGYFFLAQRGTAAQVTFPGSDAAIIPIFNGINAESATFSAQTELWGAEINVRHQFCRFNWARGQGFLDVIGGFRYVDFAEDMLVRSTTSFATSPVLLSDALVTSNDSFRTHNQLFAGQVGVETGMRWGSFDFRIWGKFALGDNRQHVNINGFTEVNGPPVLGSFTTPGGFLSQPSNTGNFNADVFSFLPECGLNVGYKLGDHVRFSAGYNFMYWYNVVRPGDQIDTTGGGGSRLFFLGGAQPAPTFTNFRETDFWAQGINLTVEVSY